MKPDLESIVRKDPFLLPSTGVSIAAFCSASHTCIRPFFNNWNLLHHSLDFTDLSGRKKEGNNPTTQLCSSLLSLSFTNEKILVRVKEACVEEPVHPAQAA
jgi:hypothetical protein